MQTGDVHPNDLVYMKKQIDGLSRQILEFSSRLATLEEQVSDTASSVRSIERNVNVVEEEPPAKKRKTPVEKPIQKEGSKNVG